MTDFLFLVPISLAMGLCGLIAFLWSLRADQYNDLNGAAYRVLEQADTPIEIEKEQPGKNHLKINHANETTANLPKNT